LVLVAFGLTHQPRVTAVNERETKSYEVGWPMAFHFWDEALSGKSSISRVSAVGVAVDAAVWVGLIGVGWLLLWPRARKPAAPPPVTSG
jgi:hypothetical protein